jgi:hypothetical protein
MEPINEDKEIDFFPPNTMNFTDLRAAKWFEKYNR